MTSLFAGAESDLTPLRVIGWFSCGATSAVACKLTLAEHPAAEIVRIVLGGEHEDNDRFTADCERWYGKPVTRLLPPKHRDHFEVAEKDGYINGPSGARCTMLLKRKTREVFQRSGDLHVFGFDADEVERANDYRDNYGLWVSTPLIDAGLTKPDCKAILERQGIELPAMYRLGYSNNNCIACWKGGMGYWNRIRVDFPAQFQRAVEIGRAIGRSPLKKGGKPLMLHDLPPDAGRWDEDQPPSCGPMCELTINRLHSEEQS